MIKPDWDKFKAKFSENPQKNFEWFCYSLFCQEYDMHRGICRYKNQSGIETNPITKNGEVIGWQAKFYETPLKDHLSDFTDMLEKSRKEYPNINKIIVYTNQEWTQQKNQHDPKTKRTIEQRANDLGIQIDWRTASFFESTFVTTENETIATHFFNLDKSIISLLKEKETHTESILSEIQTDIEFKNEKIEIDRSDVLENILKEINEKHILILSGVAGVGKTAIIKKCYQKMKKNVPFYIFKANEFNVCNIKMLFSNFDLLNFIEAHVDEENKIIVIDSAEGLIDLKNRDPFKEFLHSMIKNDWKIIFTTRSNYLQDLFCNFFDIYRIIPSTFDLQNLDTSKLIELSGKYNFILPDDKKLLELIKSPFYLNEYLKFYGAEESIDYLNFKDNLWTKVIKKSNPSREQCFLHVAFQRAKEAQFFVTPSCDSQILREFLEDGILGHETAGYFITHDIYEEWALEKIIQTAYIKRSNNLEFFKEIGSELPIRRSFRNWISEKLLLKNEDIILFLEDVMDNEKVQYYWKDQILVSILLSDQSSYFFEVFGKKILKENNKLLKRIIFLLGIACKEVDYELLKQLGTENINLLSIDYIFTKPKGEGWNNCIEFIYKNLNDIGIENAHFVLPITYDWNLKFHQGKSTRYSSLIALEFYKWTIHKGTYFFHGDFKEKLFEIILNGTSEIKPELTAIFEDILNNKWKKYRDPYFDLVNFILTECIRSVEAINALPECILQLADLFWFQIPEKSKFEMHLRMDIDEYLHIDETQDYYPSSAFQTPLYWLLKFSFKKTIDFILNFTNRAVEHFAESDFAQHEDGIKEVEIIIGNCRFKQFINHTLWNAYRGTQKSTFLFESIHMALEHFLLEIAENSKSHDLEKLLLYLLKRSKSASITAVVTSIVIAYPDKTFNVALVLFNTGEFFSYDTQRLGLEEEYRSDFLFCHKIFSTDYKKAIYHEERKKASELKHRKLSLLNIVFYHQTIKNKEISEEEMNKRQHIIWNILDEYYRKLPNKCDETDADKTLRFNLSMMDRRKTKPVIIEKSGDVGVIFTPSPEIDPELNGSTSPVNAVLDNYGSLKLWASYKIKNDEKHQQYAQYENDPHFALEKVKEIISTSQQSSDIFFSLFNRSTPADVCSVLLRDYFEELTYEEKKICKDVVLAFASLSLKPNYIYQASDGTKSAISVLGLLLNEFPEENEEIKLVLMFTLFKDEPVDLIAQYNEFPVVAINSIWSINFEDAQSILFGYLLLKPRYEALKCELKSEYCMKNESDYHEKLIEQFIKQNQTDIQKIISNTIFLEDLKGIEHLELSILKTAFQLIPLKTDNSEHKILAQSIISAFVKKIISDKTRERFDFTIKHAFLEKLAYFTLSSSEQDIPSYLKPFLDNFNDSEMIADLFQEFIVAEDSLHCYHKFWKIWDLFYDNVIELCKEGNKKGNTKVILQSYLFARTNWDETATDWHTLKDTNRRFFRDTSKTMGHCTSVLYSISKLLNGIGSKYLESGITWISEMLTNNENLRIDELETNTIYYLEILVKKYTYKNREKIKKIAILKQELLVILDFLIEKRSVVGYMIREDIL